jgi:hypothetical protein
VKESSENTTAVEININSHHTIVDNKIVKLLQDNSSIITLGSATFKTPANFRKATV